MIVETLVSGISAGTGGLSVNRSGEIFLGDFGAVLSDRESMGTKVVRIALDGGVSEFATGFEGASGNEFDTNGILYQSNIRGNTISKVAPDGGVSEFVRQGISGPVGIVINDDGMVFVANCVGNSIQQISPDGRSSVFASSSLFRCPNGLAFDTGGNLYVANFDDGNVLKVEPSGSVSHLATIPGNNNGHIIYFENQLYVVGRSAHQIFSVSLDGDVSEFCGSGVKGQKNGSLSKAEFCFPNDIALSHDRSCFYINDIADVSTDGMKLGPTSIRKIVISE